MIKSKLSGDRTFSVDEAMNLVRVVYAGTSRGDRLRQVLADHHKFVQSYTSNKEDTIPVNTGVEGIPFVGAPSQSYLQYSPSGPQCVLFESGWERVSGGAMPGTPYHRPAVAQSSSAFMLDNGVRFPVSNWSRPGRTPDRPLYIPSTLQQPPAFRPESAMYSRPSPPQSAPRIIDRYIRLPPSYQEVPYHLPKDPFNFPSTQAPAHMSYSQVYSSSIPPQSAPSIPTAPWLSHRSLQRAPPGPNIIAESPQYAPISPFPVPNSLSYSPAGPPSTYASPAYLPPSAQLPTPTSTFAPATQAPFPLSSLTSPSFAAAATPCYNSAAKSPQYSPQSPAWTPTAIPQPPLSAPTDSPPVAADPTFHHDHGPSAPYYTDANPSQTAPSAQLPPPRPGFVVPCSHFYRSPDGCSCWSCGSVVLREGWGRGV